MLMNSDLEVHGIDANFHIAGVWFASTIKIDCVNHLSNLRLTKPKSNIINQAVSDKYSKPNGPYQMKNIRFNPSEFMRDIIETLTEAEDDVLDRDPTLITKPKIEKPKMYRVILHNSDDVDGNLVMTLLGQHFNKSDAEAYRIVMAAHNTGMASIGVYTKDVAETRMDAFIASGMAEGYSIHLSMEEE